MNHVASKGRYLLVIAFLGAWLAVPSPVGAETFHVCDGYIDSLPATISSQGTWCLRGDVSTGITSGAAITVAANNVTIDCNDFKIGGLAAGNGTATTGISAPARLNTTIRNCAVRGFLRGVSLSGGGHAVLHSRFDQNTQIGIQVTGDGTSIHDNRVFDTGGALSPQPGYAVAIWAEGDGISVQDNEIVGAVGRADSNGSAYGILAYALTGSVARNRVAQVAADGTGPTYGISNQSGPSNMAVRGNDVTFFPAVTGGAGIRCDGGLAKDNIVHGHTTGIEGCIDGGGNALNP